MIIYHLKSCDTCKKAIKALAPKTPTLHEIRADPIASETLVDWLDAVGAEVLLNKRSTTWRNLSEAERAGDPLDLLIAHPTLMKRPVIVAGAAIHVGWTKDIQGKFL